jgi:hypothetical protein
MKKIDQLHGMTELIYKVVWHRRIDDPLPPSSEGAKASRGLMLIVAPSIVGELRAALYTLSLG